MKKMRLGLIVAAMAVMFAGASVAQSFQYNRIEVEGNRRIDRDSILSFAGLPEAGTVSAAEINEAFRNVTDSDLFEDVSIIPGSGRILILVVERPIISEISIEGNSALNDERLLEVVESEPRRVYNPSQAEADADRISEMYRLAGRFAASVVPKIIPRTDSRVDLVFEIVEGRVVEIERIGFVGNRFYSDSRLRRVLETTQAGFFRTFVQSDTFVAERIELDKSLLRDFYMSRGHVDFEVLSVSTELTRDKDAFFVVFNISEGQKYKFGELSVVSQLEEVDPADFRPQIVMKSGDTYSPVEVDETIKRMEFVATQQNLQFVRVEPESVRNDQDGTIDFQFSIVRGPRIFVERIDIEGNSTTLDRVIRREFDIVEGDPLNPREIAEASERIRALGYFSDVSVEPQEGSAPNRAIIKARVTEQPTGSLSFGVGYAKTDGLSGSINLTERNLLGRGQYLSFGINTSKASRSYAVSFTEPALLDRDLELTLSLAYDTIQIFGQRFNAREFSFSPSLSFPVSERSVFTVFGGIRDYRVINRAESSPIIERDLNRLTRRSFSLGYRINMDSRRDGFSLLEGYVLQFEQELSFGQKSYRAIKTSGLAGIQTSAFNEDVTFSAIFEAGALSASGGPSGIRDRFFIYREIMRGFATNGIGPRDNISNEPLGGNYFAALRLESRFPLGFAKDLNLAGGVFMDWGSVWGLDDLNCTRAGGTSCTVDDSMKIRSAAGVSLFWTTPLGPLRFNLSKAIKHVKGDVVQNFDLTLSSEF